MLERVPGREVAIVVVKHDDLHLVVVLFDEAAERESEPFVGPHAPVHAVESPWRLVLVDLLAFNRRQTLLL